MLRRLKFRLIDLQLRQRDLAKLVHLSEPDMSNIIRGVRKPSPDLQHRIAVAVGMSVHILFGEPSPKKRRVRQTTQEMDVA